MEEDFREILEELEDLPEVVTEANKVYFEALIARVKQRHGSVGGDAEQGIKGTTGVLTQFPWEMTESAQLQKTIKKEVFALSTDKDALCMTEEELEFEFDFDMNTYAFLALALT